MRLSLRTAARIAWRETRASTAKFLFVVLAVAMGVGALSGVRGFSESVRSMLYSETRTIMAADLTARQFIEPNPTQLEQLEVLRARGVDRTVITETVSMASSQVPDAVPVLVSVKAVDTSKYPYYGTVKLNPSISLKDALQPDSVIAGEDVLIRLGVKVGDTIRLGSENFRMAAVVLSEPDRMSGSLNVGLRLMISREGFERTGLMQLGSRAVTRFLFKIQPGGPQVGEVRDALAEALPGALLADSRQPHPLIGRTLDTATTFLSMVSLIALIVGAIGVAMAMYAHLQQKMDNIAVMKSLGGTSNDIIRIFTLQTLMLGLMGGVCGIVLGRLVEEAFPRLVSQIFEINATTSWHWDAAAQGIVVGLLTTLLFTLPPLMAIRKIRPALILRRDMPEAKLHWKKRFAEARGAVFTTIAILAGLAAIAGWLAGSAPVGGYFAGGLAFSLIALGAVASVLLAGLRAVLRNPPFRLPAMARQGFANLYRQGNQAQSILVAMGLGVMFTLSVYLIQNSVLDQVIATAPPGVPNVFLIGVTPDQAEPLKTLIAQQPGVLSPPALGASVAAQLTKINGSTDWTALPLARRMQRPRTVTWEETKPADLKITGGNWWTITETARVLSVDSDMAASLNLRVGSDVEFEIAGRPLSARVVALHQVEAFRSTPDPDFIFSRRTLQGFPQVFQGGVRMQADKAGALQRAVFQKFPTVTVVNVADVLDLVQQVIDQVALVIRFLSGFAILAGAIILAASIAGTRFRRVREVVILKTLGATRQHVGRIFSIEFLTLGAVAGILGALLAGGFTNLVLTQLLDSEYRIDWTASIVCIIATALLANIAGWAASVRILSQKPLEILREE